jgi:hypothetical protein
VLFRIITTDVSELLGPVGGHRLEHTHMHTYTYMYIHICIYIYVYVNTGYILCFLLAVSDSPTVGNLTIVTFNVFTHLLTYTTSISKLSWMSVSSSFYSKISEVKCTNLKCII